MIRNLSQLFAGLFLISMSHIAEARSVAPFSLPWMNQTPRGTFSTADYPNSVFVIEAYFRSCPDCNNNAPNVQALAADLANESRVIVLDVGRDTNDLDYDRWINAHHPNHPVIKDANRTVINQLGTVWYPTTYVIDCTGEVVFEVEDVWTATDAQNVRNAVQSALATDCSNPN